MSRLVFGPMTVERAWWYRDIGLPIRVFHEGRDVTKDCRFADDYPGDGYAVVMVRDGGGRVRTCGGRVLEREIWGDVRIAWTDVRAVQRGSL